MENLDELYKRRRGTTAPSRFKKPEYKKPEFDPNRKIEIDPELESYLPPLSDDERRELKFSLETYGYDKSSIPAGSGHTAGYIQGRLVVRRLVL